MPFSSFCSSLAPWPLRLASFPRGRPDPAAHRTLTIDIDGYLTTVQHVFTDELHRPPNWNAGLEPRRSLLTSELPTRAVARRGLRRVVMRERLV